MSNETHYPEYDPVEEKPSFLYALVIGQPNTNIAWCAPYHIPTQKEIATGKYVQHRYQPLPYKWMRWLFGTSEYQPRP